MLSKNVRIIRNLAKKIAEISASPRYIKNRYKWAEHNDLCGDKEPLLWICPDDDGGWLELVPEQSLETEDPDFRNLERCLRKMIYHHEHFADDYVIEPKVRFDIPGEYTGYHYGNPEQESAWGVQVFGKSISKQAYHLDNHLDSDAKVQAFLNHEVDFIVNNQELDRLSKKYSEVLDGILELEFNVPYVVLVQSLIIELIHLYGMSELLVDLYDKPEKIHGIMDHMSTSKLRLLENLERQNLLYDNRSNFYTGSGGLGYKTDVDSNPWNGKLDTMWGFADSQEFNGVSPEMFQEFALYYQKRGLNKFGYVSYGCCESMDQKIDIVLREISNIRRISISPWSSIEIAAEAIGSKAIYSWKPNPVDVCINYNPETLDANIERLKTSTIGKCYTEIILKDIRTCSGHPENLKLFIDKVKRKMS